MGDISPPGGKTEQVGSNTFKAVTLEHLATLELPVSFVCLLVCLLSKKK